MRALQSISFMIILLAGLAWAFGKWILNGIAAVLALVHLQSESAAELLDQLLRSQDVMERWISVHPNLGWTLIVFAGSFLLVTHAWPAIVLEIAPRRRCNSAAGDRSRARRDGMGGIVRLWQQDRRGRLSGDCLEKNAEILHSSERPGRKGVGCRVRVRSENGAGDQEDSLALRSIPFRPITVTHLR